MAYNSRGVVFDKKGSIKREPARELEGSGKNRTKASADPKETFGHLGWIVSKMLPLFCGYFGL